MMPTLTLVHPWKVRLDRLDETREPDGKPGRSDKAMGNLKRQPGELVERSSDTNRAFDRVRPMLTKFF